MSDELYTMMIKLEAGRERETLQSIEAFYKTFNPGYSFAWLTVGIQAWKAAKVNPRRAILEGRFKIHH